MHKTAVWLTCAVWAGSVLFAQKPPSKFITETFPPAEEVRRPDLSIEAFPKSPVAVLAYDGNGRYLATAGADLIIRLWETRTGEQGTGELLKSFKGHTARVLAIGPGEAPNTIVSVSEDRTAKTWDETSGALIRSATMNVGTGIRQLAIRSGKKPLIAVWSDKEVALWNYQTAELVKSVDPGGATVAGLALGPDAASLAIATDKGAIQIWDTETKKIVRTIQAGPTVRAIAVSTTHLAAGLADGSVKIWALGSQAAPRTLKSHRGAINALAFDNRGEQLASAGADKTVKFWDVESGLMLCTQEGHTAEVIGLSFSQNGQKMASAAADGTARTWTVPLNPLPGGSLARISAAAAQVSTAAVPQRPRRILVFWRADAILHKAGVAALNHALEVMGKKTGAYEADFSREFEVFDLAVLSRYDAIVLNSTAHLTIPETAKKAYLDYVKGGGGVIGFHAAIDTFLYWPEGAKVVGATFGDHPWGPNGTWAVKLEEPNHPLLRAFSGRNFKIQDEFYVMGEPFTRADRRVLMSVDLSDSVSAGVNLNANPARSKDHDFALAWVKHYGAGRVFYADFGHIAEPFERADINQFYLDGIQYVLGDLRVDDAPKGP